MPLRCTNKNLNIEPAMLSQFFLNSSWLNLNWFNKMDTSAELILTATTLLFTSSHVLETGKLSFFNLIYCMGGQRVSPVSIYTQQLRHLDRWCCLMVAAVTSAPAPNHPRWGEWKLHAATVAANNSPARERVSVSHVSAAWAAAVAEN
jgi:hypothetical protein